MMPPDGQAPVTSDAHEWDEVKTVKEEREPTLIGGLEGPPVCRERCPTCGRRR